MTTYYVDGAVGSDLNSGTSPGSGNAWATIGHALSTATGATDIVYVKASATYTISSTLTYPSGRNDLPNQAPYFVIGYTSSITDGGQPTIQASAAISMWTLSGNNIVLANFILDCNNTATNGVLVSGSNPDRGTRLLNLVVKNGFSTSGVNNSSGLNILGRKILIMGGKSSATGAWYGPGTVSESAFVNNSCPGVSYGGGSLGDGTFDRCVIANNTGTGVAGMYLQSSLTNTMVRTCSIYGNTSDGINAAGTYEGISVAESIITNNGGYGLNYGFAQNVATDLINFNAFYSNTSGPYHNYAGGPNDATLTGQPFANPTGSVASLSDVWTNFTLNSTAGAGAACKGAAGVGGLDLGAVQSSAGGGGTTNIIVNKMTTTYLVDDGAI